MGYCFFQIICNLVVYLLPLLLSVSGATNVSEPSCIVQLRVPRHTVFKARAMTELKINCTVRVQGCHRFPRISWCKIYENYCNALNHSDYIQTDWKNTTKHEGMAFLIFQNISMEDTGLYRCKEGHTSVSHTINVTVTDTKLEEGSGNGNDTSKGNLTTPNDKLKEIWPYVYICGGIAGLVVIVITITSIVIKCQGSKFTRKEMANKNQYMETKSSDSPPPPPHHPRHNSRSPSNQLPPVSHRGYETPPIRGSSPSGRVTDGSPNTVSTERGEEENALVYASLNHQAVSRGPRRIAQQEAEPSEYAAIRFR